MERFTGVFGIVLILAIAFLFSNNRKAINYRLVFSGLGIQLLLALFILKTTPPYKKLKYTFKGVYISKKTSYFYFYIKNNFLYL
jgi:CNT family concentrative nucleoside transporter